MPEMMYHRCFCHYYEGRFSDLCVCDNIFSKWPPEALIFAGKNGTHFIFTKSWSKNNFKPKNQFQQANPTGAQNLTLWPLLLHCLLLLNKNVQFELVPVAKQLEYHFAQSMVGFVYLIS